MQICIHIYTQTIFLKLYSKPSVNTFLPYETNKAEEKSIFLLYYKFYISCIKHKIRMHFKNMM